MHKQQYSLEYIKLKWSFGKDINLLVWGSASFNCLCFGRSMGAWGLQCRDPGRGNWFWPRCASPVKPLTVAGSLLGMNLTDNSQIRGEESLMVLQHQMQQSTEDAALHWKSPHGVRVHRFAFQIHLGAVCLHCCGSVLVSLLILSHLGISKFFSPLEKL